MKLGDCTEGRRGAGVNKRNCEVRRFHDENVAAPTENLNVLTKTVSFRSYRLIYPLRLLSLQIYLWIGEHRRSFRSKSFGLHSAIRIQFLARCQFRNNVCTFRSPLITSVLTDEPDIEVSDFEMYSICTQFRLKDIRPNGLHIEIRNCN